jgi:hypothetical protein
LLGWSRFGHWLLWFERGRVWLRGGRLGLKMRCQVRGFDDFRVWYCGAKRRVEGVGGQGWSVRRRGHIGNQREIGCAWALKADGCGAGNGEVTGAIGGECWSQGGAEGDRENAEKEDAA